MEMIFKTKYYMGLIEHLEVMLFIDTEIMFYKVQNLI